MSELQVFTYLPQRPARPKAARLAPVGLTSLFLTVGKAGCRPRPSSRGRRGEAENLPTAAAQGHGSGAGARGRAVPARNDIPGQKGLKESPSSITGHLCRRRGLRRGFREGFGGRRGAASSRSRLRQVPAVASPSIACRKCWGRVGDPLNSFVHSPFLILRASGVLLSGGLYGQRGSRKAELFRAQEQPSPGDPRLHSTLARAPQTTMSLAGGFKGLLQCFCLVS